MYPANYDLKKDKLRLIALDIFSLDKNFCKRQIFKQVGWVSSEFRSSPESLGWPIAMVGVRRRPSCVNIFISRTTAPILTKYGM